MNISRAIACLVVALCSCLTARADSRVEFIGRVDFNGLSFDVCNGNNPCPWTNVRVGEWVHVSMLVNDTFFDNSSVWPPCPNPVGPLQDYLYDIRNGTVIARAGDVELSAPIASGPSFQGTRPWFDVFNNNCADDFDLEGAPFGRGGRCCYPNGSCTFVKQTDCAGSWTIAGACTPTNTCTQPVGVCCAADNSCSITTSAACLGASGSWSFGGTCATTTCPATIGSCCSSLGSCALTIETNCTDTWTSGGVCSAAACVAPVVTLDYAMNLIIRLPANALSSADITQNYRVFNTNEFDPNRTWQFLAVSQGLLYEMFLYPNVKVAFSNSTTPVGSCCPGDGHCLVTTQGICPTSQWVSGGVCGPSTCPSAAGACCSPDGTCQLLTPSACAAIANSVYQLDGTICTTVGICPPVGACCVNGSCTLIIQSACSSTGGTWLGSTVTCSQVPQNEFITNLNIPDATFQSPGPDIAGATVSSSQVLSDPSIVKSVEVWVNFTSSRINDLKMWLTGPNGQSVPLFTRIGSKPPLCQFTPVGPGTTSTGYIVFQDSAPVSMYSAVLGGTYPNFQNTVVSPTFRRFKPTDCGGSLVSLDAAFAGLPIAGSWTLNARDERSGLTTQIVSWGLSFNGGSPTPCTVGKCQNGASCSASVYQACAATGGSWSVGTCAAPSCSPQTPGACCYLDTCTVTCAANCPSAGSFLGSGSVCSANACMVSCCMTDGTCTMALAYACPGVAGAGGSTCMPNTCPTPRACCAANGFCTIAVPVACAGTSGAVGSTCTPNICANAPVAPANDVCSVVAASGPFVTLGAGSTFNVTATLAGASADSVTPSCGSSGLPDVWYAFTPTITSSYQIQTCLSSSSWDSTLSVWSNCSTQLAGACSDDACGSQVVIFGHGNLTSILSAGTQYLIRVSQFSVATTNVGAFRLDVTGLGACCFSSGVCLLRSQAACTGTSLFNGVGSTCTPSNCQQPGACCSATGTCTRVLARLCTGTPGAEGSTCTPTTVCIPATCCRGTTCTLIGQVLCTAPAGVGVTFPGLGICNSNVGSDTSPCCFADFDKSGVRDIDDIFIFLNAWFSPTTNKFTKVGGDGTTNANIDDIFIYLNAWFAGGC